jgi:hypothetical protein
VVRQLGWTAPLEPIVDLAAAITTDAAVRA